MDIRSLLTRPRRLLRRGTKRLRHGSAGFATVGMVFTVVSTMVITLFGVGAVSRALDVYDGNVWWWSSQNSSTQRINTPSGRVDVRFALKDAQGHDVIVVQTDTHLLLHDRSVGTVTSIDLSDLSADATLDVPPGTSTSVTMWEDVVLLVDGPQGIVRRLDPDRMQTRGEPLRLTPGLVTGAFDTEGRYWLASPADGTVVAVTAGAGPTGLRVDQTVEVAEPEHKLRLTVLDQGAAVIDETGDAVTVVNNGQIRRVSVPGLGSTLVSSRTTSDVIAIAVPDSRQIVLIEGGRVRTVVVPGDGELGEAMMFAGRIYVVDSGGLVLVVSTSGAVTSRISTPTGNGPVTLEQREGHLLINQPDGPTGHVVDESHRVKTVTKYVDAGSGPQSDTVASNGPKEKAPEPETRPVAPPRVPDAPDEDNRPDEDNDRNDDVGAPPDRAPAPVPGAPGQPGLPGQPGDPGQPANPQRVPGPPELLDPVAGDGEITIGYAPPADTGGSDIEAIDIYCNNERVIHDTSPGTGKRGVSFAAQNGQECTIQGYAINAAGSSSAALARPVTPQALAPAPEPTPTPEPPLETTRPTAPVTPSPTPDPPQTNDAVPTGVTAVRKNSEDVTVSWNAVNVPQGSSLDRYSIYSCTRTGESCQNLYTSKTTSVDVVKFSEEVGGGAGATFKVSSVIDGKESALSALSNAV